LRRCDAGLGGRGQAGGGRGKKYVKVKSRWTLFETIALELVRRGGGGVRRTSRGSGRQGRGHQGRLRGRFA